MSIQDVNVIWITWASRPSSIHWKTQGRSLNQKKIGWQLLSTFLVLFLRIQISFCNLIDVWFPFWKIYIKQTSRTKKIWTPRMTNAGGFFIGSHYHLPGAWGVVRVHLCRWFLTWLTFHGYGKNNFKLLLFLGSHPTKKTNICIYLIYIHNISKCLVVTLTSRDFCGECDFDEISWLFVGFVSPEPSFIETHGQRSDLDSANLVSWIIPLWICVNERWKPIWNI